MFIPENSIVNVVCQNGGGHFVQERWVNTVVVLDYLILKNKATASRIE